MTAFFGLSRVDVRRFAADWEQHLRIVCPCDECKLRSRAFVSPLAWLPLSTETTDEFTRAVQAALAVRE